MTEPTPDREAARRLAATRRQERRDRINLIRKRTAATGAAIFALAWAGLLMQLTTGNDPALEGSDGTSAESKSTSAATTSGTTTTTTDPGSTSDSSFAGDGDGTTQPAPSAVTTTQS